MRTRKARRRAVALAVVLVCSAGGVAVAAVGHSGSGARPTELSHAAGDGSAASDLLVVGPSGARSVPVDGSAPTALTRYVTPGYGVAVDSAGDLYVPDLTSDAVVKYPADGAAPSAVSTGSFSLEQPTAVAVGDAGDLYIVDNGNDRVIEVTPGGTATVLDASGVTLNNPLGIAVDAAGDVYVSDTGLDPVDQPGQVVEIPPGGGAAVVSTGGVTLASPAGVAVDAAGDLFIADANNDDIVEVPSGGGAASVVGTGSTTLHGPTGLAADAAGDLYVGDASGAVVRIPAGGGTGSAVGLSPYRLVAPYGIATDAAGDVYVADEFSRVVKVTSDGTTSVNPYMLDGASGAAYDANGNAYVADTANGRIVEFPAGGDNPSVVDTGSTALDAPDGIAAAGNDLYIADGADNRVYEMPVDGGSPTRLSTGSLSLDDPQGVAVDSAGDVYVADSANNRIVELPVSGQGNPQVVDVSPLTLTDPRGVAVDSAGDLYIADTGDDTVVDVPAHGSAATAVTTGSVDLSEPVGVAVDPAGNLFIADHDGNQIVEVPADGSAAKVIHSVTAPSGVATAPITPAVSITYSISPSHADGSAGWYTTAPTVHFSCAVHGQPVTPGCPADATLADGTAVTTTGSFTSNGTTESVTTGPVDVDATPPSISVSESSQPNAAGWFNQPVTVHFTCSDATSGVATCPADQTISHDTSGIAVSGTATDVAGNTATASVPIMLDQAGPTVTSSPDRAPDSAGWYNQPVIETFQCADATSGVNVCPSPVTLTTNGSAVSVTRAATDIAGNSTTVTTTPVQIDTLAPQSQAALDCTGGDGFCTGATATVHVTATDQTGLSGVASIHYRVNDGAWVTLNAASTDITVPLPATGTVPVDFYSVDVAGNIETTNTVAVNADNITPSITHTISPAPNAAGWNNTDVTVTFTGTDSGGSGLASVVGNTTITTDTAGQTVTGTATSNAGLTATDTVTIKRDTVGPTMTYTLTPATPNGLNGWYTGPVEVHFTCADALSGVASCPPDQSITGDGPAKTLTVTATDVAGNSTTLTTSAIKIDATPPTSTLTVTKGLLSSTTSGTATDTTSGVDHVALTFTPRLGLLTQPTTTVIACSGHMSCSWNRTPVPAGTGTVTATAVDGAGNTQTLPTQVSVPLL